VTPSALPVVALDLFGTNRSKVTGWERYATSLAHALRDQLTIEPEFELVELVSRPSSEHKLDHLARALWNFGVAAPSRSRSSHAAIYHAPTFPPGSVAASTRVVWTVHDDLILGGHADHARRAAPLWKRLARGALGRVDAFVTSTHVVAGELAALGVDPVRIHVLAPAATALPVVTSAPCVRDAQGRECALPAEFVLAVGTIEPRKQPHLASSIAQRAGVPLVFVGTANGVNPAELGPHTYFTGRASDAELAWCYDHAIALIAPSTYEGIDLPVLEALSRGLPVAASSIPVHVELATPGVTLFDLGADEVANGTDALLASLHQRVVPAANLVSTWEELASAQLDVYRSIL
jgi:glycosyltransferase involved in cell wall biosynthesis